MIGWSSLDLGLVMLDLRFSLFFLSLYTQPLKLLTEEFDLGLESERPLFFFVVLFDFRIKFFHECYFIFSQILYLYERFSFDFFDHFHRVIAQHVVELLSQVVSD